MCCTKGIIGRESISTFDQHGSLEYTDFYLSAD